MKNNTLVVCGGTGAHVALALVRLHTLGQPLGFFRDADDKPLAFPTLYLVDQDSGDGDREATAWQLARRLVASHPGRHDWRAATGRSDPPAPKIVTPLPVGSDRTWFNPPRDSLGRRFDGSPYLDLLTSRAQRDIRFSHGMMGSPAVGSLLFRLKTFDTSGGADTNHDGTYRELLSTRGRVAVVGSAVGGTGASVAPTLARRFAADGDGVMAVMVLNWFRFEHEGLDEATLEKAQRRNRSMVENAASAFAYYGRSLADRVATVPVGVPDAAIATRRYTSDTQQPIRESFVHGVAALCGLRHFLEREPRPAGLYQLGAENPTRLGGGNRLPGGGGNDSVQSLANQAATLVDVLDAFASTLSRAPSRGRFRVVPAVCEAVGRLTDPGRAGRALAELAADYRKHVDWMKDVLGVTPRPDLSLTREVLSRERLATHPLEAAPRRDLAADEAAALAVLHWTAAWIRDHAREEGAGALVAPPARAARGGYWPPLVGHDSLNVAAERPGELTRVLDQNVRNTVQGFIRKENVDQNGWPDPLAVADHFRYAIEHGYPTARRQLEMLLAGVVMGELALRDIQAQRSPPRLSIDRLVDEYRKDHLPEFARVTVVHEQRDGDVVLGFNAPHTLLCPTPIANDATLENAWGELWQALTDSERPRDWRTEEMDEWRRAGVAVRQIRAWIEREHGRRGGAAPPWAQVFADQEGATAAFGRGRTLSVYWGTGDEAVLDAIALPTASSGGYWPDEQTPITKITEKELLVRTPALESVTTAAGVRFEMVEFTRPDDKAPIRAFWREHLDHLQRAGDIAAFGHRAGKLAVLTADHQTAAVIENAVLLDRDHIMVRDCTPMRQDPVSESATRSGKIRYPDYPLRADYLGLLETDDGKRIVDLLKKGETVPRRGPSIDRGRHADADGAREGEKAKATWELRLAGRSDRLPITLPVPQEDVADDEASHHRAHWMVWPRFRSTEDPYWRAYYVYEHCTNANLHLRTLWLDPDEDCIRRGERPARPGAYPVAFTGGDRRGHTGGPPLALSLENRESGQEQGLYVIDLTPLQRQAEVKVGLDFGTSHTVAAVQADDDKHVVELAPELSTQDDSLVLHVSENLSHVDDSTEGLKKLGTWLPTYYRIDDAPQEDRKGLLPSELLTIEPLANLAGGDPAHWQPGRDCVIPFMDMQRSDLAGHLLSDFKWRASAKAFRDREPVLREVYLGMAMELVMADVVWRRLDRLPEQVDLTFTYPLRDTDAQVKSYQRTLQRVVAGGRRSLGSQFRLARDIGIYNESSAARGGTRRFGEVCLVGDLGGGTLDLFISAESGPVEFEEVADSAKLGGNELLRTMAEHPRPFLPLGWAPRPDDAQTQLRAWMRSKGAVQLFGDGAGKPHRHAGLAVDGFAGPAESGAARALFARYFRLIAEYMARSLVAYLVRHWYCEVLEKAPGAHGKLRVLVQLRGNGWRLWPERTPYADIEEKVAKDIAARAAELWRDRVGDRDAWRELEDRWRKRGLWQETEDGGSGPATLAPACEPEGSRDVNPKAAPILRVVGEAQRHEDIRTYSHALVELEVVPDRPVEKDRAEPRIRWFDRLPVKTGGGRVELHRIEPPFPLSHPDAGTRRWLKDLEPNLKRTVNDALGEHEHAREVDFDAPIAPIVWERAFESTGFVKGQGDE